MGNEKLHSPGLFLLQRYYILRWFKSGVVTNLLHDIISLHSYFTVMLLTRCFNNPDSNELAVTRRLCLTVKGLPQDFNIPSFTRSALTRAIGNGVPYGMALALANAVLSRQTGVTLCACSCGRRVTGKQQYSGGACRKRVFDRRVTDLVNNSGTG